MDINTDAEKGRELQEILFDLAKSQEVMEDRRARAGVYQRLEALYYLPEGGENYRHLYSDIFSALIAIQKDSAKGSVDILVQNLSLIWRGYHARNTYPNGQLIDISESIRKLYDHISLDVARLSYSDSHRVLTELGGQVSDLKIELDKAQKEQKLLQKKADDFEGKLADTQKEYISILGIFSAVVLAFVGGSMFSSSVLESMSSTNIYRVIFVVDFLAFVVVSLVYLLVSFIMAINETPKARSVARARIICWWMRKRGKTETEKARRFFPITTVYSVCLLVAILDIAAWAVDLGKLVDYLTKALPWLN